MRLLFPTMARANVLAQRYLNHLISIANTVAQAVGIS